MKTVDFHSDTWPDLWYTGDATGEAGEYLKIKEA